MEAVFLFSNFHMSAQSDILHQVSKKKLSYCFVCRRLFTKGKEEHFPHINKHYEKFVNLNIISIKKCLDIYYFS